MTTTVVWIQHLPSTSFEIRTSQPLVVPPPPPKTEDKYEAYSVEQELEDCECTIRWLSQLVQKRQTNPKSQEEMLRRSRTRKKSMETPPYWRRQWRWRWRSPQGDKPGDDNTACIFCDGLFSDEVRGEVWIRCYKYGDWAHSECAAMEKDVFICDFCK